MTFNPKAAGKQVVEKSKDHLCHVQETYWQHMSFALYAVWIMLSAATLLMIHLIIPAWFQTSASTRILRLADEMKARSDRLGCGE